MGGGEREEGTAERSRERKAVVGWWWLSNQREASPSGAAELRKISKRGSHRSNLSAILSRAPAPAPAFPLAALVKIYCRPTPPYNWADG